MQLSMYTMEALKVHIFISGLNMTMDIMVGKAKWSELFEEVNFFSRYRHFIAILITAPNEVNGSCLCQDNLQLPVKVNEVKVEHRRFIKIFGEWIFFQFRAWFFALFSLVGEQRMIQKKFFQQDFLVWVGFIESKLRHLITSLERNPCIELCHVHPKHYAPLPDNPKVAM